MDVYNECEENIQRKNVQKIIELVKFYQFDDAHGGRACRKTPLAAPAASLYLKVYHSAKGQSTDLWV